MDNKPTLKKHFIVDIDNTMFDSLSRLAEIFEDYEPRSQTSYTFSDRKYLEQFGLKSFYKIPRTMEVVVANEDAFNRIWYHTENLKNFIEQGNREGFKETLGICLASLKHLKVNVDVFIHLLTTMLFSNENKGFSDYEHEVILDFVTLSPNKEADTAKKGWLEFDVVRMIERIFRRLGVSSKLSYQIRYKGYIQSDTRRYNKTLKTTRGAHQIYIYDDAPDRLERVDKFIKFANKEWQTEDDVPFTIEKIVVQHYYNSPNGVLDMSSDNPKPNYLL